MTSPFFLFPLSGVSGQSISAGTSSSVQFSAFPAAQFVELSVTSQDVYVTFDGSTPSSTNGVYLPKNTTQIQWPIERALAAKFIGAANTAVVYGTPMVTYVTRNETPSLSAELITRSVYPINHGF